MPGEPDQKNPGLLLGAQGDSGKKQPWCNGDGGGWFSPQRLKPAVTQRRLGQRRMAACFHSGLRPLGKAAGVGAASPQ